MRSGFVTNLEGDSTATKNGTATTCSLELAAEKLEPEREERSATQEEFAEGYEAANPQNRVGGKIVRLQTIEGEQLAEEQKSGKSLTVFEESGEHDELTRLWLGRGLPVRDADALDVRGRNDSLVHEEADVRLRHSGVAPITTVRHGAERRWI